MTIATTKEIIEELKNGRMVILVDEEDRENEGDLILPADFVTPEAINFMAKFGRGLICLTLTKEKCEQLNLPPMVNKNNSVHRTAFTVSIEAASGITTGISAFDRSHTIKIAINENSKPEDLVQPGHIFPLQAADGGVLMRAGHTEAGCDLAKLSGKNPSSVICEVMNDDGSMARLPDLEKFAKTHNLKIGTIADLIHYRSQNESLVEKVGTKTLKTNYGEFLTHAFKDKISGNIHLALIKGNWNLEDEVFVRVHEPTSFLDILETNRNLHSWDLDASLDFLQKQDFGIAILLNCNETSQQLINQFKNKFELNNKNQNNQELKTYGIGAWILKECKVKKMKLLSNERKIPSMTGWDLEVVEYLKF